MSLIVSSEKAKQPILRAHIRANPKVILTMETTANINTKIYALRKKPSLEIDYDIIDYSIISVRQFKQIMRIMDRYSWHKQSKYYQNIILIKLLKCYHTLLKRDKFHDIIEHRFMFQSELPIVNCLGLTRIKVLIKIFLIRYGYTKGLNREEINDLITGLVISYSDIEKEKNNYD